MDTTTPTGFVEMTVDVVSSGWRTDASLLHDTRTVFVGPVYAVPRTDDYVTFGKITARVFRVTWTLIPGSDNAPAETTVTVLADTPDFADVTSIWE